MSIVSGPIWRGWRGEAAQPVVPPGQAAPLEGDVIEHLPERDRHHREVDAAPAHDERAEHRAGNTAHKRADQERERRARRQQLQTETCAVRTEPKVGRMAERELTGESQQEIDRHGREAEDEHPRAQRV